MRTRNYFQYRLSKAGRNCSNFLKAMAAGIPGKEEIFKQGESEFRPIKRDRNNYVRDLSSYHPQSRHVSQKMTLSREKRKIKSR